MLSEEDALGRWWDYGSHCTVCTPLLVHVPPRPGYSRSVRTGTRFVNYIFPTRGVFYLTKRGTIAQHYYPGDHEICPYDPDHRMRKPEAVGGYIRSGSKDGNAVRGARSGRVPGFLWDGDEATEGQQPELSQLTMLRPWEYDREDVECFKRKWFNPFVVPVLEHDTSLLVFHERQEHWVTHEDLTERAKPVTEMSTSGRILHWDRGETVYPEKHLAVANLEQYDNNMKAAGAERLEWCRQHRTRKLWVFTAPPVEGDEEKWRAQHWRKRTPYKRHERKPWAEGWRTERKMRDLDARLSLYRWGSHNEIRDVPQMLKATRERFQHAHTLEWFRTATLIGPGRRWG